jgi:YaiO family outer membrane protein
MPDAHALLGDVYRAGGDMASARASYERARAAGDSSPELAKKIEQAVPPPVVRVDAGATYDHYSPNPARPANEGSAFTQVGANVAPFVLSLRFESFHYFGGVDNALTPGVVYRVSRDALLLADVGLTPDALLFRPRWQANLGGEVAITEQVTGLATYRHMQFDIGPVDMVMPALRFQVAPGFEAQLGGAVAHNADAKVTGAFVAKATYAYRDVLFPYLGVSYGQEHLPPQDAANVAVGSAGVVWNITPRWSVRADYSHEHRTSTLNDAPVYEHDSIGGGVTLRL